MVDTAGLREAGDEIEVEGIRRAKARAEAADLVLWLSPVGEKSEPAEPFNVPVLRILTKSDLHPADSLPEQSHALSSHTGEGIDALLDLITQRARIALRPEEPALMTRERHRSGIGDAMHALRRIAPGMPIEVAAEELRIGARALGAIIGLVGPEDVLGEIFSRFCIGK